MFNSGRYNSEQYDASISVSIPAYVFSPYPKSGCWVKALVPTSDITADSYMSPPAVVPPPVSPPIPTPPTSGYPSVYGPTYT